MWLVETSVTGSAIRMRFANAEREATHWLDFQVPISSSIHPEDRDLQLFAEVRLAALQYVRDVIGDEIHRLTGLIGHKR
jgi:hypothetical protein